jgi:hypothetical protein
MGEVAWAQLWEVRSTAHVVVGYGDRKLQAQKLPTGQLEALVVTFKSDGPYALMTDVEKQLPTVYVAFVSANDAIRLADIVNASRLEHSNSWASQWTFVCDEAARTLISRALRDILIG